MKSETLLSLLALLVLSVGGSMGILWNKVDDLDRRVSDERVKSAERFVTGDELDRRLDQSLAPLTRQLGRMEEQNERVLNLLLNRGVPNG